MSEKSLMEHVNVLKLSNEESNKLTIECLEQALIILMAEKPFNKITITEIVKKAGVSRTAFYRNYNTKEDIIQKYLTETVDNIYTLMELQYIENKDFEYWLTMFE